MKLLGDGSYEVLASSDPKRVTTKPIQIPWGFRNFVGGEGDRVSKMMKEAGISYAIKRGDDGKANAVDVFKADPKQA